MQFFEAQSHVAQVGRSRRCDSMEARPILRRGAGDCFATLAMTGLDREAHSFAPFPWRYEVVPEAPHIAWEL